MLHRVALDHQIAGGGQSHNLIAAVVRSPGRAERRPAGPFRRMLVAQRRERRGAAMPQRSRLLKRLRLASPDNSPMQTEQKRTIGRAAVSPVRKIEIAGKMRDRRIAQDGGRPAIGDERTNEIVLQREDGVLNACFLLVEIVRADQMRARRPQPRRILPCGRCIRLASAGPFVARDRI